MKFLRQWVKHLYCNALRAPLTQYALQQQAVVGICGHRFESAPGVDPLPGMAITPEALQKHLAGLQALGRFVHIDEALEPAREGEMRFMLSFDDGYRDNAEILPAILETLQIPACLFITTDFVTGRMPILAHDAPLGRSFPAMSVQQLQSLAQHPLITIGCHTKSHLRLDTWNREVWTREIDHPKQELETLLGCPVEHFAYPFGGKQDVDWRALGPFLLACGFKSVSSNFGGINTPSSPDEQRKGDRKIVHLKRAPMPNTGDRAVFSTYVLGLANAEEVRAPERYLDAGS